MARTVLQASRQSNFRDANIGHMIIFCEGMTEKLYLEYFVSIINKNKFNDITIKIESAKGNASRVLKYADSFLADESNNRKYSNYKKFLVFDCDSPPNIQKTINKMLASPNQYDILASNLLFETWLLMHFENVNTKVSQKYIYEKLSQHLNHEYEKANPGVIREILANGNIEEALRNAENLSVKYSQRGLNICKSIKDMNPYTNVNELVEQLLAAGTIKMNHHTSNCSNK
ncbi:MAG: RloB family protein [Eubacteriales bacterium]|nr:RloB family protein [Eubacteriales bacterium]MDD3503954.1 RloB family protein [Eubacteriales bacterium]MDD4683064.1 RloB family protein [Eubacteriales bacterium]